MFKKRFVHIVHDEKFIDSAFRDFEEVAPNQNIFVCIGLKKILSFIKHSKIYFVRPRLAWLLSPYSYFFAKAIIFHSVASIFEENLILRINIKTKVVWISWGFDLYPRINKLEEYLSKKTKDYFNSIPLTKVDSCFDQKVGFKKSFKVKLSDEIFISRIDFFSPVLKSEFELISDKFKIDANKYLRWNYLNLEEDIVLKNLDLEISGNSLLLGNSGSIWLNHVDALDELINLNLKFDKIVVPCSYGDVKYIDFLKMNLDFKSKHVYFIDGFLPYREYVNILMSCKYIFINSERQIALANILFFLFYNGIVVIRKQNPIVQWAYEMRLNIILLDSSDFVMINGGDIETKNTLISYWGKEKKRSLTLSFIEKIEK